MKNLYTILSLPPALFCVGLLLVGCKEDNSKLTAENVEQQELEIRFGLDTNDFHLIEDEFEWGDSFGGLMGGLEFSNAEIYQIVSQTQNDIDYSRDFKVGNPYTVFLSKDSISRAEYFVYHPPRDVSYTLIKLQDSIYGEKVPRKVSYIQRESTGIINSSLDQTILDSGLPYELSNALESVYAWTIDFFHLHKGDRFKVIYTEKILDDTLSIGVDKITAAFFEHRAKPLYAFRHIANQEFGPEYFDDTGKNLRGQFLTAPVKRSRITSRYNLRRRIAYYNYRVRPHKGTDFAAPRGTPIMSTANGRVEKVGYTSANGNYVLIRHNSIYSTQYLHMDRINVKNGQFVLQGEKIGTVGMTGNTSGPHVCYRFWKKGKQVDPFKEDLPPVDSMDDDQLLEYLDLIIPIKDQLDSMNFNTAINVQDKNKLVSNSPNPKYSDSP